MDYELIDSGEGEKLERFGPVTLIRPCSQAVWARRRNLGEWERAWARFTREGGQRWQVRRELPSEWQIAVAGIHFKVKPTDFGHLGIFPEQAPLWKWIQEKVGRGKRILNLFAYSGGASIAAAKAGARVTHLDAAKGMVAWAKENAALNQVDQIQWLVDDAVKFLARACRRKERYEGIIFDPPTFGRGKAGEVFKIEEELKEIFKSCSTLLSDTPSFMLFSCHTPGYTPITCRQLLREVCAGGQIESGEMVLEGNNTFQVPSGAFAVWTP